MVKWTRRETYKFILISLIPVVLYKLGFTWLHLPWLPIALIGTAVAFLIGFKNNASYDRLWEARKVWGGIVNTSRSWAMMVRDLVNDQYANEKVSDEELNKIRKKLVLRHIAWMAAHRHSLRKTKSWEGFFLRKTNQEYANFYKIHEHMIAFEVEAEKYLSDEELKSLEGKTNNATHLLAMQSAHLKELKERGLIWEFALLEMENMLVEMFTLQGKNERIKNFPYPRQFATLNLFFVWIFIVLLPFGIMHEFDMIGNGIKEMVGSLDSVTDYLTYMVADNFVWLSVPFSVVVAWIFHTMDRIGETSENPFEGTANDVPITTMSRGIEIDMLEMIGVPQEEIPKPIPEQYDIQM